MVQREQTSVIISSLMDFIV